MNLGRSVASAAAGYLLGTLPTADFIARLASSGQVDPRRDGSGNPGAANVGSLLGSKAGALVMAGDTAKATAATVVGRGLAGAAGANVAGAAAVVGHCYPVWTGFKGGKGIAASFGQMLGTFPAYLPVDLALGAYMSKSDTWKHRATASTGAVCALWTGLGAVWWRRNLPNGWGPEPTVALPIAAAVSSAAILSRFVTDPVPPTGPTPPPADVSSAE